MRARLHFIVQLLALQAGPYAGAQQGRVEGLGQVILGPQLDAAYDTVDFVDGGNHDDGDVPQALARLHRGQHLVAVHVRHHDVEQHEIERLELEKLKRLPAVGGGGDVQITLTGEAAAQRESIVLDVVDNKQPGVALVHDARPFGASARIYRAAAAAPRA